MPVSQAMYVHVLVLNGTVVHIQFKTLECLECLFKVTDCICFWSHDALTTLRILCPHSQNKIYTLFHDVWEVHMVVTLSADCAKNIQLAVELILLEYMLVLYVLISTLKTRLFT
jgi:hypothetical protein